VIPVLVVPHLNRPELLAAMLASVDDLVGTLVIVDNATRPQDSARVALAQDLPAAVTALELRVITPGFNLGLAAGCNLAMKATPDAPWWMLANNDVVFGAGDLANLAGWMDAHAGAPAVGLLHEFGAVGINDLALEAIGYLDENYHPIYCEDADYLWRARLASATVERIASQVSHVGSACWVGTERAQDNQRSYPDNVRYHRAKWGGGPWAEVYTKPFDTPCGDLRTWTLEPTRLRRQAWR
jgi:GT2 family glycosyltransferase